MKINKTIRSTFFCNKKRLTNKFGAKKFIVYFQSFTNAYAPFSTPKALYEKALSFDVVIWANIETRTDCVTDEILDYLVGLSKEKDLVEYGIQSFFLMRLW